METEEHREKRLAYQKAYREAHKGKIYEQIARWREAHPEKVREYNEKAAPRRSAYNKEYRAKHHSVLVQYNRDWRAAYATENGRSYQDKWYAENRLRSKLTTIYRKYGLTPDDYYGLIEAQHGLCAMCEKEPKRFVVDHDHATGQVRGLVCDRCNYILSFFDDAEVHEKAIRYLAKHLGFMRT